MEAPAEEAEEVVAAATASNVALSGDFTHGLSGNVVRTTISWILNLTYGGPFLFAAVL